MADISASMVMELRSRTGLGMMECKKALAESGGDLTKAEELLRIRSGAKAIIDGGLVGKVFITGLGLPSEMKDAVLKGACDSFAIWNPVDYGYSSTQIMINILNGAEAGPGSTVKMGRMGETTVGDDGQAAMGDPFTFDKSNVEEFAKIF
mgnify:CR=1 FL=1